MDATVEASPVGQLLDGRYRVESHIARGGMATVYLATDTRLDRTVALKIMHAEFANDEEFVRRFVGEARSVARLSHPNVVAVFDQGADGRTLYLAMEHVPGQTLRSLLHERGRLSPAEALEVMEGMLAGLSAAHDAGLAHRDVKPENVLLSEQRTVKVADFGLARLLAGTSHTKSGMLIGTAAYLAPEQVSAGRTDARTDVYAAGVVLFELLTGAQPHTGDTPLSVAYKHVNEVVPAPSALARGLPAELDTLVAMATSRDPDLRPGDAGQFLRAVSDARARLAPAPGGIQANGLTAPDGGPAGAWRQAGVAAATAPMLYRGSGQDMPATPGPAAPPGGWRADDTPARDLIPGMRPARQSFGAPPEDAGPTSSGWAAQGRPAGADRSANPTLVVSGSGRGIRPGSPDSYHRSREPGLQRWLFSKRLAYLIAGLLAVAMVGVFAWNRAVGRYTTVPHVGGLTAATASRELRNAGLAPATGKPAFNNHVAKGEVIRTSPAFGMRVARGDKVTLIVSEGPRMIAMPQVTGLSLAGAKTALAKAGLTAGAVRHEASDTIPTGVVISTAPVAGVSWAQTRPVALTVSSGPPLPNFVGQPKAAAEQWARQHSVQLNEVPDSSSNEPQGTVTGQSPSAGGSFSPGEVVTINVATGPQQVSIPNVDGMPVGKATKTLQQLGFQVKVHQIGPFKGVFHYSPNGQAPQGSTITLWVGGPSTGG